MDGGTDFNIEFKLGEIEKRKYYLLSHVEIKSKHFLLLPALGHRQMGRVRITYMNTIINPSINWERGEFRLIHSQLGIPN